VPADEKCSSVWFASGFNHELNLRLRTIPATGLHNPEEISRFFRREIAELQSSGEEACEVTLGMTVGGSAASTTEWRVVTLKMDGDGGRMVTVTGLLKNPVRVPIKKSAVGPVQLLLDEIGGTYQQEPF
jgi:hypothetical protein